MGALAPMPPFLHFMDAMFLEFCRRKKRGTPDHTPFCRTEFPCGGMGVQGDASPWNRPCLPATLPAQGTKEEYRMKIPARAFTHGGKFHADDVFSAALLRLVRPDITIQRGLSVPPDFDGLVFDIGGGMFDHHSADRAVRRNGTPYAAFGLLWKVLGAQLVGEHQARLMDENFIQPLDLNDNTGSPDSLADAIGSFNPLWDAKDDPDACFARAVEFAGVILRRRIEEANAITRADELVRKAYANMRDGIVVLPCYAPWKNALYRTEALFVVYPSLRGGFAAQCINDTRRKAPKRPFPAGWAGLADEELQAASGIAGLRFCHASRFLVTGDTKEAVLAACRQTLGLG